MQMKMLKIFSGLIIIIACAPLQSEDQFDIYLVRHSEKIANAKDPSLTQQGQLRSQWLAAFFKSKNIDCLYSSDYNRTRETAAYISKSINVDMSLYDARNLQIIADKLTIDKRSCIVVGHSNTTPDLARLLKANDVPDIDEREYSLFYKVSVAKSQTKFEILKSQLKTKD